MDTRSKILDWPAAEQRIRNALRGSSPRPVITGHFDPLLAAHVARLHEIAGDRHRLLVIVTDPPRPLLPAQARAELVAALGVVEFVALAPASGLDELLASAPEGAVVREESADSLRAAEFAARVRERHSC